MKKTALIGCECSGVVRDAFRAIGIDAVSCDLKPCEKGSDHHIQGDVMEALRSRDHWDFVGLHPDCTAMALSGNRWYGVGKERHHERLAALEWTCELWQEAKLRSNRCYIENPGGVLWGVLRPKSMQFIQPHKFGHGERKNTGIGLHRLPPLFHHRLVPGREERVFRMAPSENRKADRSRTFEGVAEAMAEQWGRLVLNSPKT